MCLEIFPETVSRVDWTNGERQTVPCTGRCDSERPISKWWKCARYCHSPRLRRPESNSAVCSCGQHDELHQARLSRSMFMQTAILTITHSLSCKLNQCVAGWAASDAHEAVMWLWSRLDAFVTSRTTALRTDCRRWRSQAGSPANTTSSSLGLVQSTVYQACDEQARREPRRDPGKHRPRLHFRGAPQTFSWASLEKIFF